MVSSGYSGFSPQSKEIHVKLIGDSKLLSASRLSSNQSHGEYPDCRSERESGGEASLLVSPLVVAGIVIGLVLFLSCVTIIVGSLRKDRQDGFSYGGSAGELRSSCLEDFPPGLDFDSYRETLSQINSVYPDSPPRQKKKYPNQMKYLKAEPLSFDIYVKCQV
uniref:Uncharacterized protein n=1 Tax=Amphilophus citrinellus TaxID=61819 RepID=A0A3Q0RY31_AMPCI